MQRKTAKKRTPKEKAPKEKAEEGLDIDMPGDEAPEVLVEDKPIPPVAAAPDPDAPIRWRKLAGSGTFRMPGKIVKPGQVFTARPSQIPKVFRDTIKPLAPMLEKEEKPVVSATDYRMEFWSEDGDVAFYNVVQVASGKAINESPLPKAEAEKLMKELS